MIFGKRTQRERQHRKNKQRRERRSKFRSEINRQLNHESLEARQLLAVLGVDTLDDVVDSTDGVISLREAINAANANTEDDTINFTVPGTYFTSIAGTGEDANVTGDYDILLNRDLTGAPVATTVTFNNTSGGEVVIDGLEKDRVFHVLNSDPQFDSPIINIDGQGFNGVNPPDTVGDVGLEHYVQMVNHPGGSAFTVYNKSDGTVALGPIILDTLAPPATPGADGLGDPIVLYDHLADRWLLTEFSAAANGLSIFVSQTDDVTDNQWNHYFVPTPNFPDYPKFAVWPDAYYVSTNEATGPAVYALDRTAMLAGGVPAPAQRFTAPALGGFGFQALTPGDLDGPAPAAGTPNYFMRHRDDEVHGGVANPTQDFLEVWEFDVDFVTPANSSFTMVADIPTDEFDSDLCGLVSFNCFAQPGTPVTLDPLREVIMHRLQYRNFGTHESLVGNFVTDVDGTDHGGVRWFELRDTGAGWTLFQEGTISPDGDNRWMGGISMDGDGNIAVGYNVSSTTTSPSIRYSGRLASDPLGTMPQGEHTLVAGVGSNASNRWGDYSAMSVDPFDDRTFWFTGEYVNNLGNGGWSTRIGSFQLGAEISAVFNDVTITGGNAPGGPGVGDGGGILNEGTSVTVNRSVVEGNTASGDGGGIASRSTTNVIDSAVLGNTAARGGGIASLGDGAVLNIDPSLIAGNTATGFGGGIFFDGGIGTIDDSEVSNNTANRGGGIDVNGDAQIDIDQSLIALNTSATAGGGITLVDGDMTITNTTISTNTAGAGGAGPGGGIGVDGGAANTLDLSHVTITNNSASAGGGIAKPMANDVVTADNVLIAGNTAPAGPDVFDGFSPIVSLGFNLIGDNTDAFVSFPAGTPNVNGDFVGTPVLPIDPHLGPLADNGGPTRTHRLKATSPAIDTGDPAAAAFHPITVDQRDSARDARHDIGAYEAGPSIHGRKFIDDNWDGFGQADEVGLEGLTIELVDAAGAVVAITHTDKNGEYWFDLDHLDLPYPATYTVQENTTGIWYLDEQTAPAPYYYGTDQIGGGELIGVDFDDGSGNLPTNWNQFVAPFVGVASPAGLTDLMDETGGATDFDVTVSSTDGFVTTSAAFNPSAATTPAHSNPLAPGLDQELFEPFGETTTILFDDLNPFYDYEIYVLGGGLSLGGTPGFSQDVTITGDGVPVAFKQVFDDNEVAINDEIGSSGRSLTSYAELVRANAAGEISITVASDGTATNTVAVLGGVAIREVGFNRSNLYQINDTGPEAGKVNLIGATNVNLDPFGGTAIDGLALANSARLFGTNSVSNELYELSRVDGDATLVGTIRDAAGTPYDIVGGLAHDDVTDTTYALARNQLVSSAGTGGAIPESSVTDFANVIAGAGGTVADVNVTLDIAHADVSDLEVELISPAGTTIRLVLDGTTTGANFTGTSFDDEALTPIAAGTTPYTGTFVPADPLALADGENPNGSWTLRIDEATGGVLGGTLNSWSLDITTQGAGLLLLEVDRATGVGTPVGTGSTAPFGDISALGFDGGVVHFYDNTFNNFHTANPTTGAIPAGTPAAPAGFNTSAMTFNSRLGELVVHDSDNPDQLLQFNPPGGVGASVLTMLDPLNLAALEHSPYDLSYTIDIALGDHVYGLDFGNEITPDDLENPVPNNSIADATDLGSVVHEEIEHLSLAGTTVTVACGPTDFQIFDSQGNDITAQGEISLAELFGPDDNNPNDGGRIIVCDKEFSHFRQEEMLNIDPAFVIVTPLPSFPDPNNPGPGLNYQSAAFRVGGNAPAQVELEFAYDVNNIFGLETIVDNSASFTTPNFTGNGTISVSENVFSGAGLDRFNPPPGIVPIAQKLLTESILSVERDFDPQSSITVVKDIGLLAPDPVNDSAFFSDLQQRFSQIPGDKIPDWDYFKVTSWATGSFDFWLDQQAGYLAAEVINGAGDVVASVDATTTLFEDDFDPTDQPGWTTSPDARWTLTSERADSPPNSYHYGAVDALPQTFGTGPLGPGGFGQGTIDPVGDFDFWSAPAQANDVLFGFVDTQNSITSQDSVLTVFDTDGLNILETDDDDGPNFQSSVVAGAQVSQDGDAYFKVQEFNNDDFIVGYELYTVIADPADVANEVDAPPPGNDSTTTANSLAALNATIIEGNFTDINNPVANPSFETGDLTGWNVIPSAFADVVTASATAANVGAFGGLIEFNGSVAAGATGTGPSLQSDVFSAEAGQSIMVDWRVVSRDAFNDDAVTGTGFLVNADTLVATPIFNSGLIGPTASTAFVTATVFAPAAGNYFLDFGISSTDTTGGGAIGGQLMVDNVVMASTADYFAVTAAAGDRIVVMVDEDPERDGVETDANLSIRDAANAILATGQNFGVALGPPHGDATSFDVTADGTYFVRLSDQMGLAGDSYRFVVLVIPASEVATPTQETEPNDGVSASGWLRSPDIDLTGVTDWDTVFLSFNYYLDSGVVFDQAEVRVIDAGSGVQIGTVAASVASELLDPSGGFTPFVTDELTQFAGRTIQLEFFYNAQFMKATEGWFVDDVKVVSATDMDLHMEVPIQKGQMLWLHVHDDPDAPGDTALYGLDVKSHDRYDAFATGSLINTAIATLFAITEEGAVAEDLPYGPTVITEADGAFLSTLSGNIVHDGWTQVATSNGTELFTIDWQFASEKTVEQRFADAVNVGEPVVWTVTSGAFGTQVYNGTWQFSNAAGNMVAKFAGAGNDFSDDDGVWGAANGLVDGDGGPDIAWGHGNFDSSDTNDELFLNGVDSPFPAGFKNFLYVGTTEAESYIVKPLGEQTLEDLDALAWANDGLSFFGITSITDPVTTTTTNTLYSIDPVTGVPTEIGPLTGPLAGATDIAIDVHPQTNLMYGTGIDPATNLSTLFTIDAAGLTAIIGLTGVEAVVPGATSLEDISFRWDGALFGVGNDADATLGEINIATGAFAALGGSSSFAADGLGFDMGNHLFKADGAAYSRLNQTTGAADVLGSTLYLTPLSGANGVTSMDFNPVTGDLLATTGGSLAFIHESVGSNDHPSGTTDLGMHPHIVEEELTVPWGDQDWFKYTGWANWGTVDVEVTVVDTDMDGVLDPEETLVLELWKDSDGNMQPDTLVAIGRTNPNDPADFTIRIDGVSLMKEEMVWLHIAGDPIAMSQNEYDLHIYNNDEYDTPRTGLYIVDRTTSPFQPTIGNIFEVDPNTGMVNRTLPLPEAISSSAQQGLAFDFAVDADGNVTRDYLYYIDGTGQTNPANEETIYTLDPAKGMILNAWGSPIGSTIDALAVDPMGTDPLLPAGTSGVLFALDAAANTIYSIDVANPEESPSTPLDGPGGVLGSTTFDPAVVDLSGGLAFDMATGELLATVVGSANLQIITVNPDGTLALGGTVGAAADSGDLGVAVLGPDRFSVDNPTDQVLLVGPGAVFGSPGNNPTAADGKLLPPSLTANNQTALGATDFHMTVHAHKEELTVPWGDMDWYKLTTWTGPDPDDGSGQGTIDVRITLEDTNGNHYVDPHELLKVTLWKDSNGAPLDPTDDVDNITGEATPDGIPDDLELVDTAKLQGFDLVIADVPADKLEMFWVKVEGAKKTGEFDGTILVSERPGPAEPGGAILRIDPVTGAVVQAIVADALYILDGSRVLKMDPNTGNQVVAITGPEIAAVTGINPVFNDNNDIVFDAAGNMFFTDEASDSVLRFTPTGVLTQWVTSADIDAVTDVENDGADPEGLTLGADGNIYLIDAESQWVVQVDPAAANTVQSHVSGLTLAQRLAPIEFVNLNDIEANGWGALYINSDDPGGAVPAPDAIIQISEALNTGPGDPLMVSAVAFDEPHLNPPVFRLGNPDKFIAIAPDGAIIVADTMNERLLRVDPAGTNQVSTLITTAQLSIVAGAPVNLDAGFKFDRGGFLYLPDTNSDQMLKFAPDFSGAVLTNIPGGVLQAGIAFGPALDSETHGDLDIKLSHGVLSDVEVGPDGHIFVAQDMSIDGPGGAGQLVELDQNGVVIGAIPLPPDAPGAANPNSAVGAYYHALGFDVAPDGTFWVTQPNSGNIVHVDPMGKVLETYNVGGTPIDAAFNPDDGLVYFTDDTVNDVASFDPASDPLNPGPVTVVAGLQSPNFLNFVAPAIGDGNPANDMFWVADESDNTIRLFDTAGNEINPPSPIGTLPGPVDPEQLGANVWTTIFNGQAIQIFDAGTGNEVAPPSPISRDGLANKPFFDGGYPVGIAIGMDMTMGSNEYTLSISNNDRFEHNDFFPGYPTTSSNQGLHNQLQQAQPPKPGLPSDPTHGSFATNVSGNWDGQALLDQVSMQVAVNPTNPDNLVIATSTVDEVTGRSYVDAYWSNDGGHTWMRTAIDDAVDGGWDPANPDNREDADVVFDQYGNAYVSYRAYDTVTDQQWIMVARSRPDANGVAGAAFGLATGNANEDVFTVAAGVPVDYDDPRLAVGPDFDNPAQVNLYVTWTERVTSPNSVAGRTVLGDLSDSTIMSWGSHATNPAGTATVPLGTNPETSVVSDNPALSPAFPDIAVGPAGNVVVAFLNNVQGTDVIYVDNDPDGRNENNGDAPFSFDELVMTTGLARPTFIDDQPDRGVTGRPSIDIDRTGIASADGGFDGRAYIAFAYTTNVDLEVMVTTNDLVNNALAPDWSTPVEPDPGLSGDQFHPQLAVDQVTGDVLVSFYTETASVYTTSARSADGGASWGNLFDLSGVSNQAGVFDNPFVDFGDYIGVAAHGGAAFFAWADNSTNPNDMDAFFNAIHPPTKLGDNGVITETIWEDELTLPWWDEDWFEFTTNFDSLKTPNGLLIAIDVIDQDGDGVLDPSEAPSVELYWDNDGVHTLTSTMVDPGTPHDPSDDYPSGPFMPIDLVNWTVVDNGLDPSDPGYQLVSKWLFDTSQVPAGQTYYLRIHGGDQMYSSEYDLHIKPTFHFEPDPWEPNDSPLAPTIIGSLPEVTKKDLTIHETGIGTTNDDWFKYTAHDTGKLILNAHFVQDVLGGLGDLNMEVWADGDGGGLSPDDLIDNRTGLPVAGGDGIPDDMVLLHTADQVPHGEQIVMPVVGQEMYWIYVYSVVDPASGHQFPNCYTLELENFPAPKPDFIDLVMDDDSGMMFDDNITNVAEARLEIEADLDDFATMGITMLTPAQAVAGATPGAAVEVYVRGVAVGFATLIPGTGNDLWSFQFAPGDLQEGDNLVKAAVVIFDGVTDDRTMLGGALNIKLDTVKPEPPEDLELLDAADSGVSNIDNMTNKDEPAFAGTGEPNAKVRLYVAAKNPLDGSDAGPRELVGQSVVTTTGEWEITTQPLVDNFYNVYVVTEDLAGNISMLMNAADEASTDTPIVIPDDGTDSAPSTISITQLYGTVSQLTVTPVITHEDPTELTITLTDPAGNTYNIDPAGSTILLAAADGVYANGDWTLEIVDGTNGNATLAQTLDSWQLQIETMPLMVLVDANPPQRPTIDLLDDTGMMNDDNVTYGVAAKDGTMNFFVTFEPGAEVLIKDGNTVIDSFAAFNFELQESQEVPAVADGPAAGSAFVLVDTLNNTLSWNVPFSGLSGAPTAAHFHGPAPVGENAGVMIPISGSLNGAGDAYVGTTGIIPAQAEELLANLWYLNIHTVANPGGELRGQVSQQVAPLPLPGLNRTLTLADGTHLLSTEVIDKVGNASHQSEELIVLVDTMVPAASTPDMLSSSDSFDDFTTTVGQMNPIGSNTDNVTNKMEPAFDGLAEANAKIRVFAWAKDAAGDATNGRLLVGQGVVNSDDTDGIVGDGNGTWEITVEPLTDGGYFITTEVEDLAGNITANGDPSVDATGLLMITVDTLPPQRPTIDLLAVNDSGMMDDDDITKFDDGAMGIPFTVTAEEGSRVLIKNGEDVIDDFIMVGTSIVRTLTFDDGEYQLSVEAFDVAGNRSHQSEVLALVVDRLAPDDGGITVDLAGTSRTGTLGTSEVTNKMRPAFVGIAEENAKVRVYATNKGMLGTMPGRVLVGQGVATSSGNWEITTEPLVNGHYTINVDVEDLAGNITMATDMEMVVVDPYEPNNVVTDATHLGSETEVILRDVLLHDDTDTDWFSITAHDTGKFVIDVGQAAAASYTLTFHAEDGTLLATDGGAGDPDLTDDGNLVVPVVRGETYNIQVNNDLPADDGAGTLLDSKNFYDLEVENFMAPVPLSLTLDPADDTGMMNFDRITMDTNPRVFVQVDLNDFEDMGVNIDAPAGTPGAQLQVTYAGISDGVTQTVAASRLAGNIWTATLANLADDQYFVNARVSITDGNGVQGFKELSFPMFLTIDDTAPTVSVPDLLVSSDTGMSSTDNVTNKMRPAFSGTAEENSKIRVLANGVVVGSGVATSEGDWEVTVEPLADGQYDITVVAEDLAGNISLTASAPSLTIEIDTLTPNTPLLDLVTEDDTGHSDTDNITNLMPQTFTMTTTDPNQALHLIPENYKFRIFDRPENGVETLIYDSVTDPALAATNLDGLTLEEFLSRDLNLADGIHNLKLEVEDRAGNISPDFLLTVIVDKTVPVVDDPDLIDSSDTGMSFTDNVTNKMEPAFFGRSEANSTVRIFAEPVDRDGNSLGDNVLVGEGTIGSDQSDTTVQIGTDATTGDPIFGAADDGLGVWEVTVEPLDDGIYHITVQVEDWAGNIDTSQNPLRIEIDTLTPNTPLLDLVTADDTGHSDTDNITNVMPQTFTMTTTDPNQLLHLIQENYKFRIFDRPEGAVETLIYNSVTDAALVGTNVDGLTLEEFLSRDLNLDEGIHNLKLEVEDRAGNISPDFLLTVLVDKSVPLVDDPDLIDSSDTGMSNTDNVTSKMEPAFFGRSEANSTVRIFAEPVDRDGNSLGDNVLVGEGTIGSDQSDTTVGGAADDGLGVWEVTVEPLDDGIYHITVQVEDWAGNIDTSENPLRIEIDTLTPNTPLLDLRSGSDPGHSDTDEIVNVSPQDFTMTTTDPNQLLHLIQENYKFRIFDRPEGSVETLIYNSVTDAALVGTNVDGLTTEEYLERQLNLANGIHFLKLEVEDRAGNISPDFLLTVQVDLETPVSTINLIDSSDTGMSNTDNVTNKMQPAFAGISEVNSAVRIFANGQLVGVGAVQSDASDGVLGDGMGVWEVTVEPLADGVYDVVAQIEDWAGNVDTSSVLQIEVDTLAPNTAFLDLVAASDSGRHDEDNITNDDTPTFTMTTTDPNQAAHISQFNYKFRIYDRPEGGAETLIYNSVTDAALVTVDGLISQEFLTKTLNLAEGVHNLKLEVEDRAGNISHDYLLDMVVDTTAPDGDLQTIELHPDSDTGVWGFPATMVDGITSDKTPAFFGAAEADVLVTLNIDGAASGTTVAVPFDGNDAFPPPAGVDGNYTIQSINNLSDGDHNAVATFTDVAGNSVPSEPVPFTVDSQGSTITGVNINDVDSEYDLFDPKPSTDGPTPPVFSLVISVGNGQLFEPLAETSGNYQLVGDHSGFIPIIDPPVYTQTGADTATITLNFSEPLPDDRFTLTVSDNLQDVVGNALDGESNATEPQENPSFPSGDGAHGGDFVGRFTIDSRPEIATWSQGLVYADINGNFVWDPEGQDNDATNRDFVFKLGEITDAYFTGNFAPAGAADASGFDKLGTYGRFDGTYEFILDTNDDGVADTTGSMAFQVNAIPVAGDFDPTHPGDEIGAYDGQNWYLDTNGNNHIDAGEQFPTNLRGIPVVGDFDGDGNDDLAVLNNNTGEFQFDLNRDGNVDDTLTFDFSGFGEKPLAGDMNLDGIDDIVVWVPGRLGQVPDAAGEWYFLLSDNPPQASPGEPVESEFLGLPSDIFDPYSPEPLGNDLSAQFGDEFALPLLGNFDPPGESNPLSNQLNRFDTNLDGKVTALDALVVINAVAQQAESEHTDTSQLLASLGGIRPDVNQDGKISALDALQVMNWMLEQNVLAEGEQAAWANASDSAIADMDDDDEEDLLEMLARDAELQRVKS